MHVGLLIGVCVMMAMMRGPPDRSALHSACTEKGEDELTRA